MAQRTLLAAHADENSAKLLAKDNIYIPRILADNDAYTVLKK